MTISCRWFPPRSFQNRFIPNRGAMDINVAHFTLMRESKENANSNLKVVSALKEEYKKKLAENLFQSAGSLEAPKILTFKKKSSLGGMELPTRRLLYSDSVATPLTRVRHIPATPDRILDAPEIVDDYYLNLLDWSSKNVVAVALGATVYLWHAETGAIEQLLRTTIEDDYISSVSWAEDGRTIAVGFNNHEVQLWDACRACKLRKLGGHTARVSSLAWNGTTLSSGGRDSQIINHDARVRHSTATFTGHSQEVCGLRWSLSGQQLASGGNDNLLHIWDAAVSTSSAEQTPPLFRLEGHQAAVKALAWCPYQNNLLASGGGTADRCIKFWNTQVGYCTNSIDTNSQVCALQWNRHQKELLSSHGFSQNQLSLWKYPSMVKIAELTGHTARVLHLSQSPDGTTVVSAAGDETLRFWKVFGAPQPLKKSSLNRPGGLSMRSIRIR
ncbi:hypothetical protein M758_4G018700 [Ceratodon purpureus]|nr:hypothetical protein M758_4G018700 [Ceratodon purpureus]